MERFRGLRHLLHDAIETATDLVQEMHESVADTVIRGVSVVPSVTPLAGAVEAVRRPLTAAVYDEVRRVNRIVQTLTDVGTDAWSTPHDSSPSRSLSSPRLDLGQSILNAIVGDFLATRGNPLALAMRLYHQGRPLILQRDALIAAYPDATERVVLFVHGLGCTEREWSSGSQAAWGTLSASYGSKLQEDLNFTPLYVRYNTGQSVADSGRELSSVLQQLHEQYPVPVGQLVLIGHSMGGLVCQAAAHHALRFAMPWREPLTHMFSLGSPHFGAPLEKASHWVQGFLGSFGAPGAQVPARVLGVRSRGIKDLRHGPNVSPITGCDHYALWGTVCRDPDHPMSRLLGDLVVRQVSASGHHPDPVRRLPFTSSHVVPGVHHLALMNHPLVYAQLRRILSTLPDP